MKHYKEYQEWLDEIQPLHNGQSYACLLEKADPIAFNCGYDDYLNTHDIEEDCAEEQDVWEDLEEDKPKEDKVYALTGAKGTACISNGNTWKESEVKDD